MSKWLVVPMDAVVFTLDMFVRVVSENLAGDDWLFRGQSDLSMPLVPAIDRPPFRDGGRFREPEMLDRFKRQGRLLVETLPSNAFEWLSLARHHGMPTRLLDWSHNPLVALYFAVGGTEREGSSGVVAFRSKSADFYESLTEGELGRPLEIGGNPRLVDSVRVTPRMAGQKSTFSLHPETVSLDRAAAWDGDFAEIVIPNDCRKKIREELRLFGTSRATLFPDLDGIAYDIRRDVFEGLMPYRPPAA